jgi:hypothetical protein
MENLRLSMKEMNVSQMLPEKTENVQTPGAWRSPIRRYQII